MSRFRPTISDRVPSGTHFAELFLSPGPVSIGATGDNSYGALFGRSWLLAWDRDDGFLHLWQERDGAWHEVVDDLPPVFGQPVPEGSRRWSFAFDQSARAVVAYEDDAGVVRVTRWDPVLNQYIQNVSFSGVDPCVVMDASWSLRVPGSDVLLFYLSSDRERLCCRVQRDVYGTEYELWDFAAPVILDRVVALPWRYQVLVSDSTGSPLPEMLVSGLYPVWTAVRLAGDGIVQSGTYDQVAQAFTHSIAIEGDGVITSGLYESPFLGIHHGLMLEGDGVIQSGVYRAVVTTYHHSIAVEGDGVIHSGDYADIATQIIHAITVEGDGEIVGGTYAKP